LQVEKAAETERNKLEKEMERRLEEAKAMGEKQSLAEKEQYVTIKPRSGLILIQEH
jgi:hypothetical protein